MLDRLDGLADVLGLIEDQFDVQVLRNPLQLRQGVADAVDDRQRIRPGLLQDRHVHGSASVDSHRIDLHRRRIRGRAHIPQKRRHAVRDLHRKVVHVLDQRHDAVAVDVVVEVADLDVAGWHQQIFGIHGFDNVVRADPPREHFFTVQKDGDLPDRAAEGGWQRHTLHRPKLRTHGIVGDVAHFLLAETGTTEREVGDWKIRRAELDDRGWKHPLRHEAESRVGQRCTQGGNKS